jgi:predicted 3-demethylubiquinone-9 3-methyltransferase (glyoxalase superfamily)
MHASFRIGETILMASDGRCEGEPSFEGFSLSIIVPDEQKAESVFKALPVWRRLDGVGSAQTLVITESSGSE